MSIIVVMRIQISDDMRNALLEFGNKYQMVERGDIEVYVSTRWLQPVLGKKKNK